MRDYRQILFGPPELDSYLSDNTKANLNEIEFFRNTMTPDVAQRAADISRAYPNMDKKLVMYGSMLGIEHDSDLALQLAGRQNNVEIKKKIMIAYSLIRIIDSGEFIDSSDTQLFIEMLRAHLSKMVEMDIIRCECGNLRLPPVIGIVNLDELVANSEE